jgi:UDP:flavonoid glycosyltransferase YjiC (YdhE family)
MNVLVGSWTPRGHLTPVLRIARALVDRGHTVTLVLSKYLADQIEAGICLEKEVRGFNLLPIDDGETEKVHGHMDELAKKYGLRLPASQMTKLQEISYEASVAPIRELHERSPFDYAVLDFFSIGYARCMVDLGIDYCVNAPGQGWLAWMMQHEGTEDWSWMSVGTRINYAIMRQVALKGYVAFHSEHSSHRPWLVNSFPEVEPAGTLERWPKLCEFTGSLAEGPGNATDLEGEFGSFFGMAAASGLPVICVSLGSMMIPDQVIIDAIYNGLAGGPWRVIWSLKGWARSRISEVDTSQFLLSPWIPQQEVLAQPGCKAFLTHGGWGGLMEGAASGVPVVALPFFGDQPENADMVVQKGWGLALPDQKVFPPPAGMKEPPEYTGRLTAEDVRAAVTRVITEASFSEAARTTQAAATRLGGSTGAAKTVENWAKLAAEGLLPKGPSPTGRQICCGPCVLGEFEAA